METLYRLIYTSTMVNADPTCIPRILRTAESNNLRLEITSLLIFDGARFCQYLEGTRSNLEALFQRIAVDDRHAEVTIRDQGKLDSDRRFPKSSIAFALAQQIDALDGFEKLNGQSAFTVLDALLPSLDMGYSSKE